MRISNLSVNRPVTVMMLMLIVVLLGMVSLTRLGLDLYPKINIPVAIVSTTYSDAGPREIENLISRPLEGALSTVSGVTNITSRSSEGSSLVILEFDFGIDMDQASLEIREQVDRIKSFLPDGADNPNVFKIDPNALPIMTLAIASERDIKTVQDYVDSKITSRLERLEGVARVDITGNYSEIVSVSVDTDKLQAYGLSYNQLKSLLISENVNLPSGKIERGEKSIPLRILGEFDSVAEIANLPLMLADGTIISLRDVADVKLTKEDSTQQITLNGQASLGMSILKTTDANTVRVAERLRTEIDKLNREDNGITLQIIQDNSVFINRSIANVALTGLSGGILAIIILFLFLRNVRSTLIIAIAIPISVIGTFALMYFGGITLNLMTLGGLALGLGMLVDNAIVVLENIYRYRELGHSRVEAAQQGTGEVSMAVVASTLTTVAVFLPIAFVEGVTSLLFKELALTVTFSLLASLIVALTIVPMLASRLLKIDRNKQNKVRVVYFDKVFHGFEMAYGNLVRRAVSHRKTTVLIAFLTLVLSVFLTFQLGAEFIPSMDEGVININIAMPNNSQFEKTLALTETLEQKLIGINEIDSIYTSVGRSGFSLIASQNSASASMLITLKPLAQRSLSSFDISDQIRRLYSDVSGAQIEVSAVQSQGFGGMTAPISITISGDDLDVLKDYSQQFVSLVESVEGTREVSASLEEGQEELIIKIDRDLAANYGMTGAQVANALKEMLSGVNLSAYKKDGRELTITLKGQDDYNDSVASVENLQIETPYGEIPLKALLKDFSLQKSPVQIVREAQSRVVTVSANLYGRDLNSVSSDIETKLAGVLMPEGYDYRLGGQTEELINSFSSLGLAFALAVALIYMIMASQFENLKYPFIIMFTVPLAFSGSVFGLYISARPISVPGLIGLIMLAGIVVNNAIVLIDYTNTLISRNMPVVEAVVEAAHTRLRPILMTTLTTVLGLVPMAIGLGEGSETTSPLATVVIGGLLFATLLTLVLIPAVYVLFNRKRNTLGEQ